MIYKCNKIKAKVVCYNYKNVRKVDVSWILKNVNDVCNRCTLDLVLLQNIINVSNTLVSRKTLKLSHCRSDFYLACIL